MNISENNIYFGDAYELIKSVPDNSVDCVYTDIPYLYEHLGGGHSRISRSTSRKKKQLKEISNGIDFSILDEFARVCKKVNVFIWCSKMQILDIMTWGKDYNTEILTWCKTNPTPSTNNTWLPDVEYCLYFREKGVLLNNGYELKSKFYISPANVDDKEKFEHPTIKPLPLVQKHILHTTKVGAVILDPFLGSGTTAVACKNTDRKYVGFEINENYYNIAQSRLNNLDVNGQTSLFTI